MAMHSHSREMYTCYFLHSISGAQGPPPPPEAHPWSPFHCQLVLSALIPPVPISQWEQGARFCWTRRKPYNFSQHRAPGVHLDFISGGLWIEHPCHSVHHCPQLRLFQRNPSEWLPSQWIYIYSSLTMSKSRSVLRKNKTTYGKKLRVKLQKAFF